VNDTFCFSCPPYASSSTTPLTGDLNRQHNGNHSKGDGECHDAYKGHGRDNDDDGGNGSGSSKLKANNASVAGAMVTAKRNW
jgi:hypothetical protein